MTDPRDFDQRADMHRRAELERMGASSPWGSVAGAVFILILLVLVFASSNGPQTARNDANPPATTGMAPPKAPPPTATMPPAQAPATTGQGAQPRGQ